MDDERKWVLDVLVSEKQTPAELISYAVYKLRKSELAKSLRDKGKKEEDIEAQLKNFHDNSLLDSQIKSYQDQAYKLLGAVIDRTAIEVRGICKTQHEKEKETLRNESNRCKNEFEELRKKYSKELKREPEFNS